MACQQFLQFAEQDLAEAIGNRESDFFDQTRAVREGEAAGITGSIDGENVGHRQGTIRNARSSTYTLPLAFRIAARRLSTAGNRSA